MADVIQSARNYRARIENELLKVERLLEMATWFAKYEKISSNIRKPQNTNPVQVEDAYFSGEDHFDFIR